MPRSVFADLIKHYRKDSALLFLRQSREAQSGANLLEKDISYKRSSHLYQ